MILWVASLVALFGYLTVVFGWRYPRQRRILRDQFAAYRRGDYEGQMKAVEALRFLGSQPRRYLFFRGSACYQLGRLDEAELALRRSMSGDRNVKLRSYCRNKLGHVLMEQGRWDDATECFRESIAELPQDGGAHRGMAELLLRHGQRPEAALEAARQALELDRAAPIGRRAVNKWSHGLNVSASLAVFAWAQARNGASPEDLESALKEAFALCGEDMKPALAELHYCAGYAYANLRKIAESRRHFQSAAQADPLGNYGRLSADAVAPARAANLT
jgi:tetratricopeptide (TPR) repeat protein